MKDKNCKDGTCSRPECTYCFPGLRQLAKGAKTRGNWKVALGLERRHK